MKSRKLFIHDSQQKSSVNQGYISTCNNSAKIFLSVNHDFDKRTLSLCVSVLIRDDVFGPENCSDL